MVRLYVFASRYAHLNAEACKDIGNYNFMRIYAHMRIRARKRLRVCAHKIYENIRKKRGEKEKVFIVKSLKFKK